MTKSNKSVFPRRRLQAASAGRRSAQRLALCAALAGLGAAPAAAGELAGRWSIEIIGGASQGDHGRIDLRTAAPGDVSPLSGAPLSAAAGETLYHGAMTFTDSRSGVTAEERCVVRELGEVVRVRCAVDLPGWLPDDFNLIKRGPNLMRGPHVSAVSGDGEFRRVAAPEPLS